MNARQELKRDLEIIQYQSHNIIADLIHYIEQDRKRICEPLVALNINWQEMDGYNMTREAIYDTLKLAGLSEETK